MTERQIQVIAMHQRGMRNVDIARELGLTRNRISQIVCQFYRRSGTKPKEWQSMKTTIESMK